MGYFVFSDNLNGSGEEVAILNLIRSVSANYQDGVLLGICFDCRTYNRL
jgi:hypothetical protein